ncbi:MAG: hypothetical protein O7G85_02050 [Planctomycetota bacterium]|nr:hypothetical protein [Planctomycetota bacterium]
MERWFEFHFPTPFQWYCNGFSIAGRFIPIRPLWPGFVVNVIFYAIPLWLLSRLPMVLRRMLRRWRGLCENCAYDFRGTDHDACPECGTEMTNP